jgi:hypothetical protein
VGAVEEKNYASTPTIQFPSKSLNISSEDDVTGILILGFSSMLNV